MKQTFSIYIHLPFCIRKCRYCAFTSDEGYSEGTIEQVIDTILLEAEIRNKFEPWISGQTTSLYLGGGTPSILSGDQVIRLVSSLRSILTFADDCECTIEVNPGTITDRKIHSWHDAGINRISLGVQSFDPPTLQRLGRIHTATQAEDAFIKLAGSGFANIGVDLIYGVYPLDNPSDEEVQSRWQHTLKKTINLGPTHVSAYSLTLEPGTPLYRDAGNWMKVKVDEDSEIEQYYNAIDTLASAGYTHYEISNWAGSQAYKCRHNLGYWNGSPYLALGPSAHGFDGENRRYWNHSDTETWKRSIETAIFHKPAVEKHDISTADNRNDAVAGSESLTPEQRFMEELTLGLRMIEGINLEKMQENALQRHVHWPPAKMEELIRTGYLSRDNGILRYTRKGFVLADEIEVLLFT